MTDECRQQPAGRAAANQLWRGGRARLDAGANRDLPEFHALVWNFGRSKPQPVYLPPYYEMAACRRRMRADPYFPSSGGLGWALRVAARALVPAALLAALALGGAALLRPSALHGLLPGFAPPVFHHPMRR